MFYGELSESGKLSGVGSFFSWLFLAGVLPGGNLIQTALPAPAKGRIVPGGRSVILCANILDIS